MTELLFVSAFHCLACWQPPLEHNTSLTPASYILTHGSWSIGGLESCSSFPLATIHPFFLSIHFLLLFEQLLPALSLGEGRLGNFSYYKLYALLSRLLHDLFSPTVAHNHCILRSWLILWCILYVWKCVDVYIYFFIFAIEFYVIRLFIHFFFLFFFFFFFFTGIMHSP